MPQRINARRLIAVAPAVVVAITALFALPQQAGGYRLAKQGAFSLALAVVGSCLLVSRAQRFPKRWLALAGFFASAIAIPLVSSSLSPTHWPTALGLLSGLGLFFVTAIALDDDEDARRSSLVVLTIAGALCAGVVVLQAAGLRWLTSDVYTGLEFRAPGTLGNPNWAAAFLAALVPLSLGLAATAERRSLHYAVAALLSVATVATLSKGGAAALVAGLFIFIVLGVPRRRRVQLLAGAAGCFVVAIAVMSQFFTNASWLRGRLFLWRAALVLVGEQPFTGVGLGGYVPAYGRAAAVLVHGDPAAFMPLSSVDFAHHDLLQFAAEGGLITALAFALLVASALVFAYRRADPMSRAAGAAVVAVVVNGFADSPLRIPTTFVLFFFLLGWLSPTAAVRERIPKLALVAIVLLGTFQGARLIVGNAYWTRGRDALRASRPAVDDLTRARFLLPEHGRSASQYARALARAGRIDAALEASAIAATLRFDFDDEIFYRDLQARALDRDAAIRQWQEFSTRFPALVTPYLRLGALHLQANDRAAAIAAYETVLASSQATPRAETARTQARALLQSLLAQ